MFVVYMKLLRKRPGVWMHSCVWSFGRALALGLGLALSWAAAIADPQLIGEDVFETDKVRAQLLSEHETIKAGEPFEVALHLTIREHWHTYWQFAGDSGAATTIDWTLPEGFAASPIAWPAPSRIPLGPLMNFGYEGEAVHFVTITPTADLTPGAQIPISASSEWLVCNEEMCIPEYGTFRITLSVATPDEAAVRDPAWGLATGDAKRTLPAAELNAAYALSDGVLQVQIDRDDVEGHFGVEPQPSFFPYEDGILKHAAPQPVAWMSDTVLLQVPAGYRFDEGAGAEPLRGLLVLEAEGARHSFDLSATLSSAIEAPAVTETAMAPSATGSPGVPPAQSGTPTSGGGGGIGAFAFAIVCAFAGGLILNLMPCVFPVLSMKALGFVNRAHVSPGELRRHGWIFTSGVLVSFVVVAGILIALRAGGTAVGWGYQLQSPLLVVMLAYLMFVIGLSLSGFVTVGASLAGVGSGLAERQGAAGAFFTGVLATLVASPCTAPFMGAALGYALMQPTYVSLLVFLSLGLGLAAPYLVLSHFPAALKWLPKPGAWMERLKEFLAFPMYATAAWLLWVMSQQTGPNGLFGALIGFVLIGFAVWVFRMVGGRPQRSGRAFAARATGAAALVLAIGVAAFVTRAGAPPAEAATDPDGWHAYSTARLEAARTAGEPVFVDFTAAWCVTCKVNEVVVLSQPRIRKVFEERNIVALRGDWTNRDPKITAVLESYDRVGVPLYLYFPPGAPEPIILPQILSENAIMAALDGER